MKVKSGNIVYDSCKEPVMVILTEQDKINIANMSPEATRYCMYPETWDSDRILAWMKDIENIHQAIHISFPEGIMKDVLDEE